MNLGLNLVQGPGWLRIDVSVGFVGLVGTCRWAQRWISTGSFCLAEASLATTPAYKG